MYSTDVSIAICIAFVDGVIWISLGAFGPLFGSKDIDGFLEKQFEQKENVKHKLSHVCLAPEVRLYMANIETSKQTLV